MKKLILLMTVILSVLLLASCSDESDILPLEEQTDPTLSITKCFDVPYQYDLSEYIEITTEDYIGIDVIKPSTEITTDDETNAIYASLSQYATYSDVDRAAQLGDSVNIDFTGSVDGVEFDGGAAEGYDMILGEAGFIDGFEDALVGHMAGEEFDIEVTFPEDYGSEDLNGKDAVFAIKMNSVQEEVLPDINDTDFLKEKFDCDSVEAYLNMIKEELVIEKSVEADSELKSNAYAAIYDNVEILDYPEDEFKYYYEEFVNYYTQMAEYYSMTLEDILPMLGTDEEEFYQNAAEYAAMYIQQEIICFAIANENNLWQDLTKGDYDEFLNELAEENDTDAATFESENGSETIWKSLILDRTINFVIDNCNLIETEAETTEETVTAEVTETTEETVTDEVTETTEAE